MADIILSPQAEYIAIDTNILRDIERNDPENISLFYSYLLKQKVFIIFVYINKTKNLTLVFSINFYLQVFRLILTTLAQLTLSRKLN